MSKSQTIGFLTLLSIALFFTLKTAAQQPTFLPITTNDGLSQNSVTSITQDSFGFIWIATQDGLNRYDGTNFTKYDAYFEDITSSTFSQLGKVYTDLQNRIWLITSDNNVSYYEEGIDSIVVVTQLIDASVIMQGSEHQYWVGSYTEGLHLLTLKNGTAELKKILDDISIDNILKEGNHLLLSTNKGVIRYDIQSSNSQELFSELSSIHVSDIIRTKENELTISTYSNGLFRTKSQANPNKDITLPPNLRIQDIHEDRRGNLWIATYDNGLYQIQGDNYNHFQHDLPKANDINYNDILCIYEDTKGNIWLGTDGGGFSLYRSGQKPINNLTNQDIPSGMAVDVTRSISTDEDGNIWIGTSGKGLTFVEKNQSSFEHYADDQTGKFYIPNNRIMALRHDQAGQLWIGTQEGGLLKLDDQTKKIKQVDIGLPCKTIWHILPKDKNQLWLCSRSVGLILFDKQKNFWKQYLPPTSQSLRVIIKDNAGGYYIGTDEGLLLRFDEFDGSFQPIDLDIETGGIKSLLLVNDDLWIGSQQKGIIIYNTKTETTKILNESNGLPNKVIYSLLQQNDRFIWASTNKGICQIDLSAIEKDEQIVVNQKLDHQNVLVNNEFNTGAYHKDASGNFYFGGIDGINWFNPDNILKNRRAIELLFLELVTTQKNNKEITPIHNSTSININYKSRNFQIRYTDLEYGNQQNVSFRYRLLGYDEEWVNNEGNRLISFSNIPPGTYTLQLSASNEDAVWNIRPQELEIVMVPAFWQTWWFKLLLVSLGILIGWYLIGVRIKSIKRTAQLQQDLAQSEAKALKAQMNPHFLFNSLNAIDNYILNNDPAKASDYLSKFSKLIRKILDNSDVPSITLEEEIDILKLYIKMEQMRFSDKFDTNINLKGNINPSELVIPPLIIQPYVENAIWHGLIHLQKKGALNISFSIKDEVLLCEIEDNGIGRLRAQQNKSKSATKRKSHGMKIAQERLKLFSKNIHQEQLVIVDDLKSANQQAIGTKVTLRFPVKRTTSSKNH